MQANLRTKCFLNLLCHLFFSYHQYFPQYFCTLLYQQLVHQSNGPQQTLDLPRYYCSCRGCYDHDCFYRHFHPSVSLIFWLASFAASRAPSIVSLAASPIVSATCVAFVTPSLAVSATNCVAPTPVYSPGSS